MLATAIRIHKALRNQADARTAHRLAEIGDVAHIAQVEFIHCCRAEGLGIAQRKQLRAAGGDRIEAGNAGSALRYRIRIIEVEVVDEVVGRDQSPARIRIQPHGPFVIAQAPGYRPRWQRSVGSIRCRNILKQFLRRNGPGRSAESMALGKTQSVEVVHPGT